ncbi:MAG: hypothetical protein Q8732_01270 [Candidatus Phytoplasma australasiaticum]|nr:hypothetical protein [Candidatus Phytoplasma australasiaticum]
MAKKIIKQITKNKSNPIIIPRKSKIPKIIIENRKPQTNWLLKITKTLGNILLWSLPLLLIGGGIYWTLFKFFPDLFHQINAFTGNVALKTKTLYDKVTQPFRNTMAHIYHKITGNSPSSTTKLGDYLATTLSVIGICLGIGKMGNWLKKGKKPAIKKGTKAIIRKQATSRIANIGGKILKISSKVLGLISLTATAYELYQFYQEETKTPNPPQQLTNKMENPSIPTMTQYHESTLTNNNEDKEEITPKETAINERITGNLNNP